MTSLPYDSIPFHWLRLADVAFGVVLLTCAATAPWTRLRDERHQHVLFGAGLGVMLLWRLEAGVEPGLELHLLGASALTLLVGPQFALLGLAALLGGHCAAQGQWHAIGLNGLVGAVAPVAVSAGLLTLVRRHLPRHVFTYVFANACFGAALSTLVSAVAGMLLLAGAGAYRVDDLIAEYLPLFFALSWWEASLTGLLITLLVIERPGWVGTYDRRLAPRL